MRKFLASALLLLFLTACQSAPEAPDTLAEIRARGAIRVGISEFEPWAMTDRHGKLIGFEVDVATKLAEDLGVPVWVVPLKFDELIPSLRTGWIDLIVAGMSITPKRARVVNFSIPYHSSEVALMTTPGTPAYGAARDDFNREDLKIGSVSGTVGAATSAWSFPKATQVSFRDQQAALVALTAGEVDGLVASSLTHRMAAMRTGTEIVMPIEVPLARTVEAFAVRKGEPDFLAFLDAWVRVRKNDQWLERRRAYWFLSRSWESRTN
jgi:polar amino acid transport system substrate-binding protein